jgi:hypothetical protein
MEAFFPQTYMSDKQMIVLTALSGVNHHSYQLQKKTQRGNIELHANHNEKYRKEWKDARLVIISKILFASSMELIKINAKLQDLLETIRQKISYLNIAFLGDVAQLHPVSANPLR